MKKTLFTLACIVLTGCVVSAQNNILEIVETGNAKWQTLSGAFQKTEYLMIANKTVSSNGELLFQNDDKMAMHYMRPSNNKLIINGDNFYIVNGHKKNCFDTKKNIPMCRLRNTLIMCLKGRIKQLSKEQNTDVAVEETAKYYVVTLTAKKKSTRGYSKIVLNYSKKNKSLAMMRMEEFNGNYTIYEMSNVQFNAHLDIAKFKIPTKDAQSRR